MANDLSRLSQEELVDCFNKYLLSAPLSISSVSSDRIAQAYRFGLSLEISGAAGLRYGRTMKLIRRLGVPCKEVAFNSQIETFPIRWTEDPSVSSLRVWVADPEHEDFDLGLLVEFYFDYHVRLIRSREPDFPLPQIDATYLLWLDWLLRWKGSNALSNKILRDLLTRSRGALWSVPDSGSRRNNDANAIYETLMKLRPTAQRFLGFCGGPLGELKIEIDGDLANHSLNHRAREFIQAMADSVANGVVFPWFVRRFSWPIGCIRRVATNTVFLNYFAGYKDPGEQRLVDEWLHCRLRGMTDEEIGRILFGPSFGLYQSWTNHHRIDTEPATELTAVDDWLKACETIGLEPDPTDVGAQHAVWEAPHTPASHPAPQPVIETPNEDLQMAGIPGEFRHSPDYRSVVAVDGRTFVLSPKQAEVISMLHSNYELGTPEISQARIIDEISPDSKEKKLRRFFRYDEAFDALIQTGTRKGLVRLRISEK